MHVPINWALKVIIICKPSNHLFIGEKGGTVIKLHITVITISPWSVSLKRLLIKRWGPAQKKFCPPFKAYVYILPPPLLLWYLWERSIYVPGSIKHSFSFCFSLRSTLSFYMKYMETYMSPYVTINHTL